MYGAEVWGHIKSSAIQTAENVFCRKLLGVSQSTPAFMIHQELGLQFISDVIAIKPLLLWVKVWLRPECVLNKLIIKDILALDKGPSIDWL